MLSGDQVNKNADVISASACDTVYSLLMPVWVALTMIRLGHLSPVPFVCISYSEERDVSVFQLGPVTKC